MTIRNLLLAVLGTALALAAGLLGYRLVTGLEPLPATPALWRISDAQGHEGWLLGTIHSAPAPLAWHSPKLDAAFAKAGTVLVEVANLRDDAALSATFARLARTSGQPPLSQRVPARDRPALAALLAREGFSDNQFGETQTWAAALTLANAASADDNAANGVDRAVLAAAPPRPVVELEGAEKQLSLFAALPEREQRDLLSAIVHEAQALSDTDLTQAWRKGDVAAIAAQTHTGLLADPELRAALYTGRNRAWAPRIASAVHAGQRPFVAVGAAHMVGSDGLVALLRAQGFAVRRVQ
ncbi:TraB/GumN family protein [Novosphingobium sp. 1949]|uniref:TraB/GumN family protein n=1 Tax=Novosphingobium organovorum TaxID=2930092 RepID=A0ABT0B9X5_9SPHN|nr:TraB/GumN family protein [Novosphingobium organovorum]MCJ2181856.1 TraB/GumN family protein [Novosphingobium organovorum]